MKTNLYVLSEPGGPVRYVGKTRHSLAKRLGEHLSKSHTERNHRAAWIRRAQRRIEIHLVETVAGDGSAEEVALIAGLRDLGAQLVNATSGGDGNYERDADTKARIAAALRGHAVSDETRRRIGLSGIGRKLSDTTRKRMAQRMLGSKHTEASRAKMSRAARNRSDAHRAKLSAALTGITRSDETKKKIAATKRARTNLIVGAFAAASLWMRGAA